MQPLHGSHLKQSSDPNTQQFQAGLIATTKREKFVEFIKKFYSFLIVSTLAHKGPLLQMSNCEIAEVSLQPDHQHQLYKLHQSDVSCCVFSQLS